MKHKTLMDLLSYQYSGVSVGILGVLLTTKTSPSEVRSGLYSRMLHVVNMSY